MKLVNQEVKVWGECPTDPFEAKLWIEKAGRTCYNSRIPEVPDPDKFLNKVMSYDPPHSSMFEHSNLCLMQNKILDTEDFIEFERSKWINKLPVRVSAPENSGYAWAIYNCYHGNYRAWMEMLNISSIDDLFNYLNSKKDFDIVKPKVRDLKRVTVELHTDRNVLAEITRHRDDVAFSVRSQRYVDENGLMEFIKPSWFDNADFIHQETFRHSCQQVELNYRTLRKTLPPQHARTVLNGQVKTVIVMTAYLSEWDWIFKLRRAPGAYPQMILLMNMVYDKFKGLGYVENI